MYYNNSDCANQENAQGVWSNGYVGVYHMSEASGPIANSVSASNYGGRVNTPTRVAGQMGYGQEFTGSNSENGGDDAFLLGDLGLADGVNENLTISVWGKLDTGPLSDSYGKLISKRNDADTTYIYWLELDSTSPHEIRGGVNGDTGSGRSIKNVTWHYHTLTYDGSEKTRYLNDTVSFSEATTGALTQSNATVSVGARADLSQELRGILDEVRLSNVVRSSGWVETEYSNQWNPDQFFTVGECNNRKTLTLNSSQVTADLTDFPVLINITDSDLAKNARPEGWDIYFTKTDGTRLYHELSYYNATSGHLRAWVRIPSLSSTSDTSIYMYYNHATAGNHSNPMGVWDENYRGVWHLQEFPKGTVENQIKDSTTNRNHLQPQGGMGSTNPVDGYIDGSLEFDGTDDEVRRLDADAPTLNFGTSDLTIESWVRLDTDSVESYPTILERGASGGTDPGYWLFWYESNSYIRFYIGDGTSRAAVSSITNIKDGSWHHVVAVADRDGKGTLYIDGDYDNGADWSAWDGNSIDKSGIFSISDDSSTWDGGIDEVRISASVRSPDWKIHL
jgi:hypothetical protein